jgi:hypothetical protein
MPTSTRFGLREFMAFNIKTRYALALRDHVLARPPGHRNAITGFWVAGLKRVQSEPIVRIAFLDTHQFVLEADIDVPGTHVMIPGRIEEYLDHERLKHQATELLNPEMRLQMRLCVQRCIDAGRIVVAFRNARAIDGDMDNNGRNPIWYTNG